MSSVKSRQIAEGTAPKRLIILTEIDRRAVALGRHRHRGRGTGPGFSAASEARPRRENAGGPGGAEREVPEARVVAEHAGRHVVVVVVRIESLGLAHDAGGVWRNRLEAGSVMRETARYLEARRYLLDQLRRR